MLVHSMAASPVALCLNAGHAFQHGLQEHRIISWPRLQHWLLAAVKAREPFARAQQRVVLLASGCLGLQPGAELPKLLGSEVLEQDCASTQACSTCSRHSGLDSVAYDQPVDCTTQQLANSFCADMPFKNVLPWSAVPCLHCCRGQHAGDAVHSLRVPQQ